MLIGVGWQVAVEVSLHLTDTHAAFSAAIHSFGHWCSHRQWRVWCLDDQGSVVQWQPQAQAQAQLDPMLYVEPEAQAQAQGLLQVELGELGGGGE